MARFYKAIEQLIDSKSENASPNSYLNDLSGYFSVSTGMLDFPFETFKNLLEELGLLFPDNVEYDNLIDIIASIDEKRSSELTAGLTFLKRAGQKFISKRYKESIIYFGKSILKLAKEESKDSLFVALKGLGHAYNEMDLLMASNNCFLSASSIAFKSWHETGIFDKRVYDCIKNLVKNEQIIGRIPNVLTWYELFNIISTQIEHGEENEEIPILDLIDGCLSVRFLNTDTQQDDLFSYLPDILEYFNLGLSKNAVLFKLGYSEVILKDYKKLNITNEQDLNKFFELVASQPFRQQMIYPTNFLEGNEISIYSKVLGCSFIFSFAKDTELLLSAETFAAFFECFLATSLKDVYPNTESIKIKLVRNVKEDLFRFKVLDSSSEYLIEINIFSFSRENIEKLWERMMELTGHILAANFFMEDPHKLLVNLFKNEELNERLTFIFEHRNFTLNVLGDVPKLFFDDWKNKSMIKEYPSKRKSPIKYEFDDKGILNESKSESKFDLEEISHNQRKVSSIIDTNLWDKAKWIGFGFYMDQNGLSIFIGYTFIEEGKKIFTDWIKRFGCVDSEEKIKITLIRGVDKFNPSWYRVHIGTDVNKEHLKSGDIILSASRFHEMNANSPDNLNNLISAYNYHRVFHLCPAEVSMNANMPKLFEEFSILKHEITIRNAWEIGLHDLDSVVIKKGDNPIIPDNVENAPILEVLKQKDYDKY